VNKLSISQAAKELGITSARLDQLLREGRIKYTVDAISGWRLIDSKELEKLRGRKPGRPRKD
jgi:predicted site-specific integrase-resolvase